MKHILSRGNREVLQQFACSNVVLAFDYDGTLAPIVSKPERASMRAKTRTWMERLTKLYPCIVISGRAQADAWEHLRGVGILEVVGNHGVEPWQAHGRFLNAVRQWRPVVDARLGRIQGIEIEDKKFSLSIHYRRSREKKKALDAIMKTAALLGRVRVIGGKQVVNILPDGAPHKGMALEKERTRLGCDTAVYVGDDETDEDVFTLDQPGRLLTIRVGGKRTSMAAYCVRDQSEIDELIEVLVELRNGKNARKARR